MSTKEEGIRPFEAWFRQVDEGALHAEASDEAHRLFAELEDHALASNAKAKGKLTITIDVTASPKGTISVVGNVTRKAPKKKTGESIFWLTKGRNLTAENPRQTKLPLREVPPPERARELDAEAPAPVRSV
jgi:hypothetical protein